MRVLLVFYNLLLDIDVLATGKTDFAKLKASYIPLAAKFSLATFSSCQDLCKNRCMIRIHTIF